jgi:hypothetical protein
VLRSTSRRLVATAAWSPTRQSRSNCPFRRVEQQRVSIDSRPVSTSTRGGTGILEPAWPISRCADRVSAVALGAEDATKPVWARVPRVAGNASGCEMLVGARMRVFFRNALLRSDVADGVRVTPPSDSLRGLDARGARAHLREPCLVVRPSRGNGLDRLPERAGWCGSAWRRWKVGVVAVGGCSLLWSRRIGCAPRGGRRGPRRGAAEGQRGLK